MNGTFSLHGGLVSSHAAARRRSPKFQPRNTVTRQSVRSAVPRCQTTRRIGSNDRRLQSTFKDWARKRDRVTPARSFLLAGSQHDDVRYRPSLFTLAARPLLASPPGAGLPNRRPAALRRGGGRESQDGPGRRTRVTPASLRPSRCHMSAVSIHVPRSNLVGNRRNPPRMKPERDADLRLVASIRAHWLPEVFVVRPTEGHAKRYHVIAGNRWLCAVSAHSVVQMLADVVTRWEKSTCVPPRGVA